ncbi:RNA methyltransferase [Bittarella massiliensis]|uniref:TrmH family RNA methyltransferase n=1 Tax=Bittarella massiliensis (ex Durand et al. 2017) TaxID=1720313 RepID=UPI00163C3963|nr:RNA methyltransferase [Bittarella massiliensis (ex Durand et al. 2017)]
MSEHITSRDNPRVKAICRLRSSAKARREAGLFLCEGARLCAEAAASGAVESAFFTEEARTRWPDVVAALEGAARSAFCVSDGVMAKISGVESPQGVLAACRAGLVCRRLGPIDPGGHYLLLDGVADPGNLGTIVRSGCAFSVTGIIAGEGGADFLGDKVVRGAMGAIFKVPLTVVPDLAEAVGELQAAGIPVYGSALHRESVPVGQIDWKSPCALVVGNEGAGISPQVAQRCDKLVEIPMAPGCESLNAGVAASLFLWEMAR